jgi:hypothetical protein
MTLVDERHCAEYRDAENSKANRVTELSSKLTLTKTLYFVLVSKCPGLKVNFTLADVSDTAKELCKNWLYKVASIRG